MSPPTRRKRPRAGRCAIGGGAGGLEQREVVVGQANNKKGEGMFSFIKKM